MLAQTQREPNDALVATIVHELPGRIRVRLSTPVRDWTSLEQHIKGHEGILSVGCTPISGSVLVEFDPSIVKREEIVIRLGLSYSQALGGGPVRVLSGTPPGELSDSALYAGVMLSVATVARLAGTGSNTSRLLDLAAALSTAGVVVGHGLSEVKGKGSVDPEVFSVVYLLVAMVRQNGGALPAAIFTWFTTFARHLIQAPPTGIELRPTQVEPGADLPSEVVISSIRPASAANMGLNLVSSGLRYALTGHAGGPGELLHEIDTLAKHHDQVLEGLGDLRQGIPVKVQL